MRTYTHPSVYEGIRRGEPWADPIMDPTLIDWPARQAAALIPFETDEHGPVNPCEDTDVYFGRNYLGHWGPQTCADALVTATCGGRPQVVMVQRKDGYGWALPGGYVGDVELGETPLQAAPRELAEEASLVLPDARWQIAEARYVPDPRASRQSWMETAVCRVDLGAVGQLPPVHGRDDAARAAWIPAGTYDELVDHLAEVYGGCVFRAHVELLRDHLG